MFRKHNGITKKLYTEYNCLYLKADMEIFTFGNAAEIEHALVRNIKESIPTTVVLDMESIRSMDSTAVGVLIHVTAECKKENCTVYMCNITDTSVRQVLHMLQIEVFIPIIDLNELLEGRPWLNPTHI